MNVVIVTSALFCLGLFGVLTRRELIAILASIELMLGAANVQLVAYARVGEGAFGGAQAFSLFILVLAAAEAAVGLALVVALVRRSGRSRAEDLGEVEG